MDLNSELPSLEIGAGTPLLCGEKNPLQNSCGG
jgi:hypothetical protein